MYKAFDSLEELFAHMKADKDKTGAEAAQHNRYPVRFVLFDNFADFKQFVNNRPNSIFKQSVDTMLDRNNPDEFLSHTELSKKIRTFINERPALDIVICPFSEMARFYDNTDNTEFDALVKTIGTHQAPEEAQEARMRLYIPIVGMQGKMGSFMNHNSIFVWEYRSATEKGAYNLIITNGTTYGVSGLDSRHSVVRDLREWLKLWEKGDAVKSSIICSSPNIFASAHHAQPDNAFTYVTCRNAFEFLTKGLGLDFGTPAAPPEEEMRYWEQLAAHIDIDTFDFDRFVRERCGIFSLEDGMDFVGAWLKSDSDFDRWLLARCFKRHTGGNDYLCHAVEKCQKLNNTEFFSNIATLIFDEAQPERHADIRRQALCLAAEEGIKIPKEAEERLRTRLEAIAASPEKGGHRTAARLLTPLTDAERRLCIEWVGNSLVRDSDIKEAYPELFHYLQPLAVNIADDGCQWISEYFDAYRRAKVCDRTDERVARLLGDKNADSAAFHAWHGSFKTVKTLLHSRKDIEVFYWIDGLGADWIPFIRHLIAGYDKENIYLNEVYVAAADIPTTTTANKAKLESLPPEGERLPKAGDLDSFAHSAKAYPQYIIDEMRIVEEAVRSVLSNFNGRKIAIVSDHGLTYLSQLADGLNLGGIEADHEGRTASYSGSIVNDGSYVKLDDGKTICALTHRSLAGKVPKGHGAHGGCTPEEVLVPIFVVSSQKNATNYTASLKDNRISGTNPVVRFVIKGLAPADVPSVVYNDVDYNLRPKGSDVFESERLHLVDTATRVSLHINRTAFKDFDIEVSTGATEDDLFG